ncbi:MAG: site-specific integrase [Anaerolineales bacterium]|jgi:integrase
MAKRRAKGEGTIFQDKRGYWVAEITLPSGKRKRKYEKTQREVKEWLLQQREAISKGLVIKDDRVTVAEYFEGYLNDVVAHTLKPKTVSSYKYIIESHVIPELGSLQLVQLRPDHLQSLYARKLDSGLSKRTVQYIHAVIRKALNQAVKWGLIYRNPTDAVTAPRPKKKPPEVLTEAQAKKFLETVEDHRWYPIYVLAITTGMREGEILGLHWEDIDFENEVINVIHAVNYIAGKSVEGQPKTDKSRRTIALPSLTIEVLKGIKDKKDEGLVFTTSSGKPISHRNLLRHFHASLEKAGIKRIRFHDLRHTFATFLLKKNVHPKVVQSMLGHSTISLTLDTYSHVIPDMQDKATEKIDEIFDV